MKEYKKPLITIASFETEDIITTSGGGNGGGNGGSEDPNI